MGALLEYGLQGDPGSSQCHYNGEYKGIRLKMTEYSDLCVVRHFGEDSFGQQEPQTQFLQSKIWLWKNGILSMLKHVSCGSSYVEHGSSQLENGS